MQQVPKITADKEINQLFNKYHKDYFKNKKAIDKGKDDYMTGVQIFDSNCRATVNISGSGRSDFRIMIPVAIPMSGGGGGFSCCLL